MTELIIYISFFGCSILLFLPSAWARRASSRPDFTITLYRIFFSYNVTLMVINLSVSKSGNIPLTDIEDAPFVDIFSLIFALIYGYMMATLQKPENYSKSKLVFYPTPYGNRRSININLDRLLYMARMSVFILGCAGFYTVFLNYLISEFIPLKPNKLRLAVCITYPFFVLLGIWGVLSHHKKHGNSL